MKKVIESLRKYDTIFVTGAQRSGTNIASKIIAHELGKKHIHESEFDVHDFDKMLTFKGNAVIQAPALCHMVKYIPKDIGVVFMVRDFDDIIKSQKRVGWHFDDDEKDKYYKIHPIPLNDKTSICEIKHRIFFLHDNELPNTYHLHYESLSEHPLWVNKELRKNFNAWQTEIK